MRVEPAIFEMQGSMLTIVPRPFHPNQNTIYTYSHVYCLSDAFLGNFHESSKADHTPQVSARRFLPASADARVELYDELYGLNVLG